MVIFKKRWCRNFVKRLTKPEETGFWQQYRNRIPSNVSQQDIAEAADVATIKKCMTKPAGGMVPEGHQGPSDFGDGNRFHENFKQPGYVTYRVERGGIFDQFADEDLKKVFTQYISLTLDQLA